MHFRGFIRKFERNPIFLKKYKSVIEKRISEGTADLKQDGSEKSKIYYLLHQAVIGEDKYTCKLRVIFYCSSHSENSQNLNNNLDSGSNLNLEIFGYCYNVGKT